MNKKEIATGNEIIGEFMGDSHYKKSSNTPDYHSDWNQLMRIILRIEGLGHATHIVKNSVMIKQNNTISSPSLVNIFPPPGSLEIGKREAVWQACVKFAEWYKLNKR